MTTYNKLAKAPMWNPYVINSNKLESFAFYDPSTGIVLCQSRQAWLSVSGSNNDGNNVLEELEFRTRRKPFLNLDEPHVCGGVGYIPVTSLPNFEFNPDSLHSRHEDGQENYGHHITFDCGATSRYAVEKGFTHLTDIKPRTFLVGGYTRTEYTGESGHQRALESFVKEKEIGIRSHELQKLRKLSAEDKRELFELIGG